MSDTRPAPLTPAGCDLRDFPHTPLFRSRLFGSSFHARADDSQWRAGVTLWLKSWDQVPAGSLPTDDIELCRLAELARDLKKWRKLKAEALRGWIACTDGRLYHPVVAEGVNNAIEKKAAQRAKTAKARIASLEKRLKEAKTDDERAHITDEVRKIKQTQSQGLSQTLSQPPREGKGEGEGEGEGNSSVPNGTGGKPPADPVKQEIWDAGRSLLSASRMPAKQVGSFLGKLVTDYGSPIVLDAVRAGVLEQPADASEYLKACCMRLKGERPTTNRQEALEQRNRAIADDWANGDMNATH